MGILDLFWKNTKHTPDNYGLEPQVMQILFPCGEDEINSGVDTVERMLSGRLRRDECRKLYITSKYELARARERGKAVVVPHIVKLGKGRIADDIAQQLFTMLGRISGITYGGGDGSTPSTAVVVGAPSSLSGVVAQYAYLQKKYGTKDVDWTVVERTSSTDTDTGKQYSYFDLKLRDGAGVGIWFDVTCSFGKI